MRKGFENKAFKIIRLPQRKIIIRQTKVHLTIGGIIPSHFLIQTISLVGFSHFKIKIGQIKQIITFRRVMLNKTFKFLPGGFIIAFLTQNHMLFKTQELLNTNNLFYGRESV